MANEFKDLARGRSKLPENQIDFSIKVWNCFELLHIGKASQRFPRKHWSGNKHHRNSPALVEHFGEVGDVEELRELPVRSGVHHRHEVRRGADRCAVMVQTRGGEDLHVAKLAQAGGAGHN